MKSRVLKSAAEVWKELRTLESKQDVARLLGIPYKKLRYILYVLTEDKQYSRFEIPKRSGGTRVIHSPTVALKRVQRKLAVILQAAYKDKQCVFSYVRGKSIVGGAKKHLKRQFVLNVDLEDFFPSINFGRVRGIMMSRPYDLNIDVATLLAQICCVDNQLPQGAPTSPIVSNMICGKLDSEMMRLAKRYRCTYSRYADDLTLSTWLPKFPEALAFEDETSKLCIGDELLGVIKRNGFNINYNKGSLRGKNQRQKVTGIIVNRKTNVSRHFVRQIRAMLHALEKFGYEDAEAEYRMKYNSKLRNSANNPVSFGSVLRGKIEFLGLVRGKDDGVYRKFLTQLHRLEPDLVRECFVRSEISLEVHTEGTTDAWILKRALDWHQLRGTYHDLHLTFACWEVAAGDAELMKTCKFWSTTVPPSTMVAVFDRDVPYIVKGHRDIKYRIWSPSVYSLLIPLPRHRKESEKISIEFYLQDHELLTPDTEGRRMFLAREFDRKTGRHLGDASIHTENPKHKAETGIIDSEVYCASNSMAMSKAAFAENLSEGKASFSKFDFSEFSLIFNLMRDIGNAAKLQSMK